MKSRGFKDVFHDINDIILAIVIVLIAAVIIAWRFDAIMDYPEIVAKQSASNSAATQVVDEADDAEDLDAEDEAEAEDTKTDDAAADKADKASDKKSSDKKASDTADDAPTEEESAKANG